MDATFIPSFNETMRSIHTTTSQSLAILTMTVCASLNSELNINALTQSLADDFEIKYHYDTSVRRTRYGRPKKQRVFFNALSFALLYTDMSHRTRSINIKIFHSGNIHIAGCQTAEHVHYVPELVYRLIYTCHVKHMSRALTIEDTVIQTPFSSYRLSNVRVVMLHTCYEIPKHVYLYTIIVREQFYRYLFKLGHVVRYNSDLHNGIILKIRTITFIIFCTGKILITGKGPLQLYETCLNEFLSLFSQFNGLKKTDEL